MSGAVFSPDGSRLVVTTHDGPAVHVWDLRAIRRKLARMGLDWEAPAYPDDDPASPALSPLPPLEVDLGPHRLGEEIGPRLIEDLTADVLAALARKPDHPAVRGNLAADCNRLAWGFATGSGSKRDPKRALALARGAVELDPKNATHLNTLGVSEYRTGHYAEAIATLERSMAAGRGRYDGFDLFFVAMAQYRLGHHAEARSCYDRAVAWSREQKNLRALLAEELAAFRAEAEAVLAERSSDLPSNVFAEEYPGPRH